MRDRASILAALGAKEINKPATCDVFLSSLGIGLGPYAEDGTGGYCHDDKLHPNNAVASSEAWK